MKRNHHNDAETLANFLRSKDDDEYEWARATLVKLREIAWDEKAYRMLRAARVQGVK